MKKEQKNLLFILLSCLCIGTGITVLPLFDNKSGLEIIQEFFDGNDIEIPIPTGDPPENGDEAYWNARHSKQIDNDDGTYTTTYYIGPQVFWNGTDWQGLSFEDHYSAEGYYLIENSHITAKIYDWYTVFYDPDNNYVCVDDERWIVEIYNDITEKWREVDLYNPTLSYSNNDTHLTVTRNFDCPDGLFTITYNLWNASRLKHDVEFKSRMEGDNIFQVVMKLSGIRNDKVRHKDGIDNITSETHINSPYFIIGENNNNLVFSEYLWELGETNETTGDWTSTTLKDIVFNTHAQGSKCDIIIGNYTLDEDESLLIDPDSDTFYVVHGYDDAYGHTASGFDNAGNYLYVYSYSNPLNNAYRRTGVRFQNVAIPQGSTVTAATVSIFVYDGSSVNINTNIYGNDVDDALDFNDLQEILDAEERPRTDASVSWIDALNANDFNDKTGLQSIVHEIVNRGGWNSNNALVLLFIPNTDSTTKCVLHSYDKSSGDATYLAVTWEPPVVNNAPTLTGEIPANSSTGIGLTPTLNVTVDDADDDWLNVTWLSNSSNSWVWFAKNSSIDGATLPLSIVQMNSNFSTELTKYWWSVNVSDGTTWTNETYHFTTASNATWQNLSYGYLTGGNISSYTNISYGYLTGGNITSQTNISYGYLTGGNVTVHQNLSYGYLTGGNTSVRSWINLSYGYLTGGNVTLHTNLSYGYLTGGNITSQTNISYGFLTGGNITGYSNISYGYLTGGNITVHQNLSYGYLSGGNVTVHQNLSYGYLTGGNTSARSWINLSYGYLTGGNVTVHQNLSYGYLTGGNISSDTNLSYGYLSGGNISLQTNISYGYLTGGNVTVHQNLSYGYLTGGNTSVRSWINLSYGYLTGGNVTLHTNLSYGYLTGGNITSQTNISYGFLTGGNITGYSNISYGYLTGGNITVHQNLSYGYLSGGNVTVHQNLSYGYLSGGNISVRSWINLSYVYLTGGNISLQTNISYGYLTGGNVTVHQNLSYGYLSGGNTTIRIWDNTSYGYLTGGNTSGVLRLTDEYPTNGSIIFSVQPTLFFTLASPLGDMSYKIYIGNTDTTTDYLLDSDSSLDNGTFHYVNYYNASSFDETYYWRMHYNDTVTHVNESFSFTIEEFESDVSYIGTGVIAILGVFALAYFIWRKGENKKKDEEEKDLNITLFEQS